MATIVAEALLSASVKLLSDKIISREFVDFFRSKKLDVSLLEKLKTTLLSLQAVLNDAEEKQITNPAVKQWLDKLRDAVFEADDLFDEINTEALRCKVKAEYESQTVSAKVRNILSSRFKRFYGVINSLAAVALGGLLRTKLSQDDWNNVFKSSIWDLANVEVQPALLLSYHYLPAPLKQCFAYCSIFSKNSILEKKMVVQLWIAEGLVHQSKSQKSWEKVGEEYFDELVSRSLIHRQSVNDVASFEMHDLIHDLATMVSSPHCIRLGEQKLPGLTITRTMVVTLFRIGQGST